MSRFDDDFATFAAPDLLREFGDDVERGGETITAIVVTEDPAQLGQGRLGEQRLQCLEVMDGDEGAVGDAWTIVGETWTASRIGEPKNGFRKVYLKRSEERLRTGPRGVIG